ncbi:MAG TPA: hypothetical protein PKI33_08015 [Anaerolineales bacterium]|nr:hypothetical protein [Anaerolineales bacterium]HNE05790.1 hypothetical protein [Anaerolineales bacterium]HNF93168.1 hypothetical protein [Anaerolineales bacterium]HNM36992.1 hypothetical protein [Anaerolineales bacterium]
MFRRKITLFVCIFLVGALSACNLPSSAPTETETSELDLALTITALASSPNAPQETSTPEFTATAGPTSTPSVPQVSVSQNTNCRVGPGIVYDLIDSLLIGQTAEIVGKNSGVPNYWVIKRINGSGTCWLWGEYATVTGNTANLPEYPVPPTPTPSPTPTFTPTATPSAPAAVENVTMTMSTCGGVAPYQHGGTLAWEDKSNNEDGFNIYVNNVLIASIPANSTSYNVAPAGSFAAGIASKFEVEAFNGVGKAAKKSVAKGCP